MADQGGVRCSYCWNPFGEHNDGCPVKIGTPEALVLWEKGRTRGFEDETRIPQSQWRHYNPTFIFGYRVGQCEIDELVEAAVEETILRTHEREY